MLHHRMGLGRTGSLELGLAVAGPPAVVFWVVVTRTPMELRRRNHDILGALFTWFYMNRKLLKVVPSKHVDP